MKLYDATQKDFTKEAFEILMDSDYTLRKNTKELFSLYSGGALTLEDVTLQEIEQYVIAK